MDLEKFDFEAFKKSALDKLKAGQAPLGKDGAFTPLLKVFLEEALQAEMEGHFENKEVPNRRNGKNNKMMRTSLGLFDLDTPMDSNLNEHRCFTNSA